MAEVKKTEVKPEVKAEGKTKTIRLPIIRENGDRQEEFYSYNFKNYLIRRGEDVEVPVELYDLIVAQQEQEDAAYKKAIEMQMKESK